jgi:hypothetical protein
MVLVTVPPFFDARKTRICLCNKVAAEAGSGVQVAMELCQDEGLDFHRTFGITQLRAAVATVKLLPGKLGEQQRQVVVRLWDEWSPAEDQAVWVLAGDFHLPDDAFDHEEPDLHFRISR